MSELNEKLKIKKKTLHNNSISIIIIIIITKFIFVYILSTINILHIVFLLLFCITNVCNARHGVLLQ